MVLRYSYYIVKLPLFGCAIQANLLVSVDVTSDTNPLLISIVYEPADSPNAALFITKVTGEVILTDASDPVIVLTTDPPLFLISAVPVEPIIARS